jgi:glycosyltransferase involved in cell wall biosynthesis
MEHTGLGRYAVEIANALSIVRPNWQFSVFSNRPDLLGTPGNAHLRHTRWPSSHSAGRVAWLHVGSIPAAVRKRPDVWFGPTFVLPFWWSGPAVVTIQDLVFDLLSQHYVGRARARYATAATKLAARKAARIIAPSSETRDALVGHWGIPAAKVDIIPNGVSEIFFSESARSGGTGGDIPYMLFVGVFEPRKGLEVLERAVADLNRQTTRVKLVLAGRPGWRTDGVVDALMCRHDVEVIESPTDDVLARLYRGALVLVYPSQMEGFGLPVAEAMASGCPVIATDLDCVREFAGEAPLYIRTSDPAGVVRHVDELLNDQAQSDRRGEKGRATVHDLRWQAVAERVASAIAQVAR